MMVTDSEQAMHNLDLVSIKDIIEELGLQSAFIEKTEVLPLSIVLTNINPDYKERERAINFSFIPMGDDFLEDTKLLQYYTQLPFGFDNSYKSSLQSLLLAINLSGPIGNYGIKDDEDIYFRYVQPIPKYSIIEEDTISEVLGLFIYMVDAYEKLIEEVATGNKEVDAAIAELEPTEE